jgi:hypothetical protein
MRHTVEIADSQGKTMQLSVSVDNVGWGGSWRSIDKGMIRRNSGPVNQWAPGKGPDVKVELLEPDGKHWGVQLEKFISWGTVNDQGTGTLLQPWCIGLTPGDIEWSIV